MMATDKKSKAEPAPKSEPLAKDKTASEPAATKGEASKAETAKPEASKAEVSKTEPAEAAAAAPKGYTRGEGQKPVTQAYKDNWNAIYGKKKKKR